MLDISYLKGYNDMYTEEGGAFMELKIDKKLSRGFWIAVLGFVVAYLLLRETERVRVIWNFLKGIFSPFVVGALLAFILNVLVRFFETKLTIVKNEKLRRTLAIASMLLSVVAVLAAVLLLLVPQIEATIELLILQLPIFYQSATEQIDQILQQHPQLLQMLGVEDGIGNLEWMTLVETVMNMLETSVSSLLGGALSLVSTLAVGTVNAVISLIFAFYCLAQKETLARQGRKLSYAILSEKKADEVIRVFRMVNSTFSNFITGQCLEAVILGLLFVPTMAAFRMPYIPLICVIITVTALVPLVGAFVGCFLGAFFILVNDPGQAVAFVIMFLVIQQFEGNVIYPKVVGESIGLPGMWVLLAVAVGGGMWGVAGMLLMVPMASVIYNLVREYAQKRVADKNVPLEKLQCQPPELQPHFVYHVRKRQQERRAVRKDARKEKKANKKEKNAIDN